MKIVTSEQMAELEALAFKEGASERDFMEEAGSGVALVVHEYAEARNLGRNIVLVCGRGNNAGDAYVAGQHLLSLDYQVTAFQLYPFHDCSQLCQEQYHEFFQEGGRIVEVQSLEDFLLPNDAVIIDGIFGTGFHGEIDSSIAMIIEQINVCGLPVISVDIPSGVNGNTGEVKTVAVRATETAFLGLPKKGLFLLNGWDYAGKLRYVDFGLSKSYIDDISSDLLMMTAEEVKPLLPKIKRSRNKYEAGYVVGLAGSPGMSGAALMAADGALHSGAGIVRLLYPKGMEGEFGGSNIEIIKEAYNPLEVEEIAALMNKASANFIGPGMGRKTETFRLLQQLFPLLEKPCVIDADALNFLAEYQIPLPKVAVLTPHRGEMNRLLNQEQSSPLDPSYLQRCLDYAVKEKCTLVLKGGPTFILQPGDPIHVNPKGDPGMATAGSGDLLTGLIAGLLAQGIPAKNAAKLGVYIHAIAGEFAALEMTSYCMTASDILYHFPEGFLFFEP